MKPSPFEYVRARSTQHALESLTADDTKLIAGGQSLLPLMNLRMAAVGRLVDIDGLTELDRVVDTDGELLIGALTRHDRLHRDPVVRRVQPLFAEAAAHIGHVAIRNRGTIGGSLAHADPTAELPAVCVALGAVIVCDRADGRRREVPAADFLRGRYETALEADEMITWVRVPRARHGTTWGFCEVAPREGDFAWAGACTVRTPASDDVASLRVVVFGVEPTPTTFETTWPSWVATPDLADRWAAALEPHTDPEYLRELAAEVTRRAVADTVERVHGA